jgi:nuclear RNA export factor
LKRNFLIDRECSVYISLDDWQGINTESFISWLSKKAKGGFSVIKTRETQDTLILTVRTPIEVQNLCHLNGYSYGPPNKKQILKIEPTVEVEKTDSFIPFQLDKPEIRELIKNFISMRYDPSIKLLNLGDIPRDQSLMNCLSRLSTGAWNLILNIASTVCPDVESISFVNNELKSLGSLRSLPDFLPNCLNLSFANNEISSFATLDIVLSRMKNLREVVLTGNPLLKSVASPQEYRKEFFAKFPSVKILDTIPQGTFELDNVILGSYFDRVETRDTVGAFLMKYMYLFDGDRNSLVNCYSQQATFSLTIMSLIPIGALVDDSQKGVGVNMLVREFDKTLESESFTSIDRNPYKLSPIKDRVEREKCGPENIINALDALGVTRHSPIETYVVDSWQIPGGGTQVDKLVMNVHGELIQSDNNRRYFDRIFVLTPALPGSKALISGWPVEIISDILCIRPTISPELKNRLNGIRSIKELKELSKLADTVRKQVVIGLTSQQQEMVMEFSKITGLNSQYSVMCLTQYAWNYNESLQGFESARHNLPPEAFQH